MSLTSHTMRHRWLGTALTCLLLVTAACGDDDEASSSPRNRSDPSSSDDGPSTDGREAGVTLDDLLGTGGSIEDRAGQVRETDRERQEIIRDCMAEQGFDYVVHVVVGQVDNPMGLPTNLTDEEFRRQYGYGIATGFESALNRRDQGAPDAAEDPNLAIVEAMSPAERTAYEQALRGSDRADGSIGGCEGEAIEATDRAGRLNTELGDQLDELSARITADSRLVDAERDWVECMEDAGYPFADERAIRDEVMQRLNPLNDAAVGSDVPDGVVDLAPDMSLTEDQQALLADIRTFELAVANADQDCREDLDEIRKKVRAEYEASFVDANRDRLREIFPDAGL